jgi:DNA (cytosine-5)-methyltransferase 1
MNTYLTSLDAAWQAHLTPRAINAPTVISLFAGAGGSSLGYSMAGYRECLAVEWDADAVTIFRRNLPEIPVCHGDITQLSVEECLQRSGLNVGDLDVLDGSPPCQGFSTGGKRRMDDPRNALFHEYVRLLRGLQPRAFVLENVPGLVQGKMRLIFAQMLNDLKASGYRVSARVLNSQWFGVPQHRKRLIVIGVRSDLTGVPSHPAPWGPPPTVDLALAGVAHEPVPDLTPKYQRLAPLIRPGQCAADVDAGKGFQNLVRLRWDRPSPTLTRLNPGHGRGTPLHPTEHRSLSIPEAKRLCAFPDPFVIEGESFQARWGVLGNAVPPLFMQAIARHIRTHILTRVTTLDDAIAA